ncbi:MAG: chromophore lyase CpcT/CpeT [Acidobacteriota bacterium]|nr:chromophore lyase CpcT/CpeT [Acidobacteriota bacterium]
MKLIHLILAWMIAMPLQAGDRDLDQLAAWMTGVFSSREQAAQDESYFHIRLVMAPIWTDRTDGHWLYVEQAAEGYFEKPYRQRIYHVRRGKDGRFESVVYTMEEPLQHAGAWRKDKPLSELSPKDLKEREGCTVFLEKSGDTYKGGTHERDCVSKLRGATYATSEITINKDTVLSWDRGFDDQGKHVWGAEKAGYIFKKEGTVAELRKSSE